MDELEDPTYNKKSVLDLMLDAEGFEEIIEPRFKWEDMYLPRRQGFARSYPGKLLSKTLVSNICTVEFQAALKRYFDMEDVPDDTLFANECEIIYDSTVSGGTNGRYAVTLSFEDDPSIPQLGNFRSSQRSGLIRTRNCEQLTTKRCKNTWTQDI